jgi:hypothetical protein
MNLPPRAFDIFVCRNCKQKGDKWFMQNTGVEERMTS